VQATCCLTYYAHDSGVGRQSFASLIPNLLSSPLPLTMTNLTQPDLAHPALARIPPWVQEKLTPKAVETIKRVHQWVETECIPAEPIFKAQLAKYGRWKTPPSMKELRQEAKKQGLFNLFLPKSFGDLSPGLTNLEYSCCAEIMGRCYWAAQVSRFNWDTVRG
jgi:acyl-CoA dehydrogenase